MIQYNFQTTTRFNALSSSNDVYSTFVTPVNLSGTLLPFTLLKLSVHLTVGFQGGWMPVCLIIARGKTGTSKSFETSLRNFKFGPRDRDDMSTPYAKMNCAVGTWTREFANEEIPYIESFSNDAGNEYRAFFITKSPTTDVKWDGWITAEYAVGVPSENLQQQAEVKKYYSTHKDILMEGVQGGENMSIDQIISSEVQPSYEEIGVIDYKSEFPKLT